MFRVKNVSTRVISLYRSKSLDKIEVKPGEVIEVFSINEFINLEGLLDPSKNILIVL